jgi:hypothetical protein
MRPVAVAIVAAIFVQGCPDASQELDASGEDLMAEGMDTSAPRPDTEAPGDGGLADDAGADGVDEDALAVDAPPSGGGTADAALDPCSVVDCSDHGSCVVEAGVATCLCEEGWVRDDARGCVPVCDTAPCTEPGRGVCSPEPSEPDGFVCACDPGRVLDGDRCVPADCASEVARTFLTVYDQTPLPGVTDPVRSGFDPLLRGDSVRVVVRFTRTAGAEPHRAVVSLSSLTVAADSVTLDGASVTPSVLDDRRLEVDLPPDATSGQLAFDGTIGATAPGLLAIEARAKTAEGCAISGSASGARVQLTGQVNPKHNTCNNLGDLRALQISTGVPDKDTSVYEQRNGSFNEIGATYKVLTQMTLCLSRPEGVTVSLAGSADATRPWTIDNHLLIEVYSGDPSLPGAQRTEAWITTSAAATAPLVFQNGDPIRMLKHASMPGDYTGSITPSFFTFPAGVVQLDAMLPAGQPSWLRITGLDAGVAGHLSHLFLTASAPGVFVPECQTVRDCPRPDSRNGDAVAPRAGCIDGRCTGPACANQSACPRGQACLLGFCSVGCNSGAPCPTGTECAAGFCVDVAAGGCRTVNDCPTGHMCFFGRCEPGCFHPVRQNPTYADNYQTSFCKTNPAGCPRCGDASRRCFNNYCRDCEIDAHCQPSERCSNDRCVPR